MMMGLIAVLVVVVVVLLGTPAGGAITIWSVGWWRGVQRAAADAQHTPRMRADAHQPAVHRAALAGYDIRIIGARALPA